MKVSKKNFIIPIIIVCSIVLVLSCITPILYFLHQSKWQYTADFETYVDSLKTVAYYCKDVFEENPSVNGRDYISYSKRSLYYKTKKLDMPLEVQHAVARIGEAFDDEGYLDTIRYNESRISFSIINGRYALVYSFNDEKPKYVNSPDESGGISVKKIENNWYHVVKNTSLF